MIDENRFEKMKEYILLLALKYQGATMKERKLIRAWIQDTTYGPSPLKEIKEICGSDRS